MSAIFAHYSSASFPRDELVEWFGKARREVCFVKNEVWSRRLKVESGKAFRDLSCARVPDAVHLGGVFEGEPGKSRVIGRELVFDVDLDAYSDLRACCGAEKKACAACWKFARVGMQILSFLLRNVFGYKRLLFMYTGNRGFHLWVLDAEAFSLSKEMRTNIVRFLDQSEYGFLNDYWVNAVYEKIALPFYEREIKPHIPPVEFAKPFERKKHVLSYTWPRVDRKVTPSLEHPSRMPLSYRSDTKQVCWILDENTFIDPFTQTTNMEDNRKLFLSALTEK